LGERLYTQTHEWVSLEGNQATIGITDYAQSQLGDVVFVELPKVGAQLQDGDAFGSIESVKSASDLYSPVAGAVVEINGELQKSPESVNKDPYGAGWMVKIELSGAPSVDLLDEAGYTAMTVGNPH
jgi:glycine cleavage system H protein